MEAEKLIELKVQILKTFAPYFDTPNELLEYCDSVLYNWIGLPTSQSIAA
jgi:hypothetical protein